MKKNKNLLQILLNLYIFLYLFSMINREFKPFNFDLRFIVLPLGCFIILLNLMINRLKLKIDKTDKTGKSLILFYIIVFLCNISWLWNGINIDRVKFFNELLLLSNTFIGILVVFLNKRSINFEKVLINTIISCVILSLSIIAVYNGVPFDKIMGDSNEADIYYGNSELQQSNIFGDNFRCAGYASDPNYATILLFFGIISTIKSKKVDKTKKIILNIFFIGTIGLSWSKTVIIGSIFALIYMFIYKKSEYVRKHRKIINRILLGIILTLIFIIPTINLEKYFSRTLTIRFAMWRGAKELFLKSPIIGSGITSFRSFFEITHENWYVQCHSTFWQVLSETGLFGIIFYVKMLINALDSKKTLTSYFLVIVFVIWSMTYETIALPLSTFVLYILELENIKES